MKRWLILATILIAALGSSGALWAMPQPRTLPEDRVAGELLVKYSPAATVEQRAAVARSVGGTIVETLPALNIDIVRLSAQSQLQGVADVVGALEQQPAVEYAQPNYRYHTQETGPSSTRFPLFLTSTWYKPNDPRINAQYAWNMLHAFKGWTYTRGSADVVIAVVDSGVQLSHPEFAGKLVAGPDYIDDDGVPDDENGHGTHVAGIAAAGTDNGIGVAGTCPECRIMPVRVLDANGAGRSSDVIQGIAYAVDHGADVINMSLGGNASDTALRDALDYAWGRGAFVACAAGNNGALDPMFPAYYDNCLAVGAVGSDDLHASYSNYGRWVDIAAPGTSIYSTYPGGNYATVSGTSMATPYVAGTAGLLASQGLSNAQIRARLEQTADATSGTGVSWSNGRLNIERALRGY